MLQKRAGAIQCLWLKGERGSNLEYLPTAANAVPSALAADRVRSSWSLIGPGEIHGGPAGSLTGLWGRHRTLRRAFQGPMQAAHAECTEAPQPQRPGSPRLCLRSVAHPNQRNGRECPRLAAAPLPQRSASFRPAAGRRRMPHLRGVAWSVVKDQSRSGVREANELLPTVRPRKPHSNSEKRSSKTGGLFTANR